MNAVKLEFANRSVLKANLLQLKQELLVQQSPAIEPASATVEAFSKMPVEMQKQILSNISTYIRVLSQDIDKQIEPGIERSPRIREIARLRWALNQFGLKPMNNDVFNVITLDDVIELYNIQGIQLYRNMRFFKVCSYNLLELSVHPWEVLYDKPTHVIESTQKVIERLFETGNVVPYSIPTYLQKEKYEFAKSLKTLQVTPRYIVPLYDAVSGQPAGAFSTYSAEVIAEGDQSSRFNTI